MPHGLQSFYSPTRLILGRGSRSAVPDLVRGRNVAIVSSPTVLRLPPVQEMLALVTEYAAAATVVALAAPNPRVEQAQQAADGAKAAGANCFLAVGGGSVLDCAKAARVALSGGTPVRTLLGSAQSARSETFGLICVPTAFGTGAETSAGAILTDDQSAEKLGVRGAAVVADHAIIDPDFADFLPQQRRTEIAFDALAHAIESYLSLAATPITDVLAEAACDELPSLLLASQSEQPTVEVMDRIAMYAALMGFNLANSSTCLPHRMQYAVARIADSSHQSDLLAMYPAWLSALQRRGVQRLDRALSGLRRSLAASSVSVPEDAGEAFDRYRRHLGLSPSLRAHGLLPADADRLTNFVSGNVALDPLKPTSADIRSIFSAALA